MIKTVEIKEFDKDTLKVGSFISFCYTRKNMTDVGIAVINGVTYNGMIKHVDSKYITITLHDGEIKRIFIEEILSEEKRILGVLSNAITPEDVEPEPPESLEPEDKELESTEQQVAESDVVEPNEDVEDVIQEDEEKEV